MVNLSKLVIAYSFKMESLPANMVKKRAHLIIAGRVQGVFFRATARDTAKKLDLTGWIRNNPNGVVESIVEGSEENIKKYIEFCHDGSSAARVQNVDITWEDYQEEFDDFNIVR